MEHLILIEISLLQWMVCEGSGFPYCYDKKVLQEIKQDEKTQLLYWDLDKQTNIKDIFRWLLVYQEDYPDKIVARTGIYECLYKIEFTYDKVLKKFIRKATLTPVCQISATVGQKVYFEGLSKFKKLGIEEK